MLGSLSYFSGFTQTSLLNYLNLRVHHAGSILFRYAILCARLPTRLCFLGALLINKPDKSAHYYELKQDNCMCHIISRGRGDKASGFLRRGLIRKHKHLSHPAELRWELV